MGAGTEFCSPRASPGPGLGVNSPPWESLEQARTQSIYLRAAEQEFKRHRNDFHYRWDWRPLSKHLSGLGSPKACGPGPCWSVDTKVQKGRRACWRQVCPTPTPGAFPQSPPAFLVSETHFCFRCTAPCCQPHTGALQIGTFLPWVGEAECGVVARLWTWNMQLQQRLGTGTHSFVCPSFSRTSRSFAN